MKVISLFSGVGGLELGLRESGSSEWSATELSADCCRGKGICFTSWSSRFCRPVCFVLFPDFAINEVVGEDFFGASQVSSDSLIESDPKVEFDEFARCILEVRQREGFLHRCPVYNDVTTFSLRQCRSSEIAEAQGITLGFPCQVSPTSLCALSV